MQGVKVASAGTSFVIIKLQIQLTRDGGDNHKCNDGPHGGRRHVRCTTERTNTG
jgi:hypothetical protein